MSHESRISVHGLQAIPPGWEPIAEFAQMRGAWEYAVAALELHRAVIICPRAGSFSVWVQIHIFWID